MNDELPEGWAEVRLAAIADVALGKMLDAKRIRGRLLPYLRNANVRWGRFDLTDLKQMHFKDEELARYTLAPNDLLVCEGGEPGRAAVWTDSTRRILYQKALLRVRPYSGIDPRWVMYSLQAAAANGGLEAHFTGTTIKHFPQQAAKEYAFALAPTSEQGRIIAKIEALFEKVRSSQERLDRVLPIIRRFRRAVLTAACTGQLTASYRRSRVDKPWQERSLGEVVVAIEAGRSFTCEERPPTGNEVGVLKISAVTWGKFDENESKTCMDPALVNMEYFVHAGDLLMTRANTIELVGAVALVERVSKKLMLSDKTLRIQVGGTVSPRWVLYWLRSQFGREQIESLATGNQQSMRNISQGSIRAIKIRVPPPEEQKKIESTVEALMRVADQIETRYKVAKARVDRLAESILAKAFRGELVPREAELARSERREFESAAQLLDRIKNARATPVKQRRTAQHTPITKRSRTKALT